MSDTSQLIRNYNEIRDRLRYPPNAVPDAGIDLKRKKYACREEPKEPVEVIEYPPDLTKCIVSMVEIERNPKRYVTLAEIRKVVCTYFHIDPQTLRSRRRHKEVVYPRQIYWYLASQHTLLSLPTIGRTTGHDHTTVIHSRDKIVNQMRENLRTAEVVKQLETMLCVNNDAASNL